MRRWGFLPLGLTTSLALALATPAHSQVADIDRDVAAVQRQLSLLRRDSVDLSGFSSEGGDAMAYRDSSGALRLIRVRLYGESGRTDRDFYFHRGALILCSKRDYQYNAPITMTDSVARQEGLPAFDPKKTRVLRASYYFVDGRLIRWRDQSARLHVPKPAYRDTAQALLSFADTLLARVR